MRSWSRTISAGEQERHRRIHMSAAGEQFQTAVRGIEGVWPVAPSTWSYSSLSDAEECPRRWMLTRARYPTIWEREGYPPRPNLAGLLGNVTHRALELILGALQARGCASVSGPVCGRGSAGDRRLLVDLLEDTIAAELETLQRNPRAAERLASIRERLLREIPAVRERLQATISRTHLYPPSDGPIVGTVTSRGGLARWVARGGGIACSGASLDGTRRSGHDQRRRLRHNRLQDRHAQRAPCRATTNVRAPVEPRP